MKHSSRVWYNNKITFFTAKLVIQCGVLMFLIPPAKFRIQYNAYCCLQISLILVSWLLRRQQLELLWVLCSHYNTIACDSQIPDKFKQIMHPKIRINFSPENFFVYCPWFGKKCCLSHTINLFPQRKNPSGLKPATRFIS